MGLMKCMTRRDGARCGVFVLLDSSSNWCFWDTYCLNIVSVCFSTAGVVGWCSSPHDAWEAPQCCRHLLLVKAQVLLQELNHRQHLTLHAERQKARAAHQHDAQVIRLQLQLGLQVIKQWLHTLLNTDTAQLWIPLQQRRHIKSTRCRM